MTVVATIRTRIAHKISIATPSVSENGGKKKQFKHVTTYLFGMKLRN